MARLAILGGGRMGEALVGGLVASGHDPSGIAVAEVVPTRRKELAERFAGLAVVERPAEAVPGAATVVVAVKPSDVAAALGDAVAHLEAGALVLSIAAGVRIASLESLVPGQPVVRAMPNTPALVGRGAAAVAPGTHATDEHLEAAEEVLGAVGTVTRVPEKLLDAVTGLSGSGPAYVFLVAEALIEAGIVQGLPRPVAEMLVTQTLLGAATMLAVGVDTPEALRAAVTSPGGTTAAGLRALEARAVRSAFVEAVAEATRRSQELGDGSV